MFKDEFMLTESEIFKITFYFGLIIFVFSIVHNMLAAKYLEANNNSLTVSVVATIISFTLCVLLTYILISSSVLLDHTYGLLLFTLITVANTLVFASVFNVDLVKGLSITLVSYLLTAVAVATLLIIAVWLLDLQSYSEVKRFASPYVDSLVSYLLHRNGAVFS
jgi:ABC-type glycerol-3-phosphate transport system permease component